MSLIGLLLIGLAALLTAISNLALRSGLDRAGGFGLSFDNLGSNLLALFREPLFITGVILYGIAALVWFRVISTENLSSAYPLLVSITFMLVTLGAVMLFHEPVSWPKMLGICLILAGIVLVARVY